MNASASTPAPNTGHRAIIFFGDDLPARQAVAGARRFLCLPWEELPAREGGSVVVTSSERLLAEHWQAVSGKSRVRVIALSDDRFKDHRLDGEIYAYLPAQTPTWLIERMVENALSHIQLLSVRQEFNERRFDASSEIDELNRIGAALSAEHDTQKLLELILTKSRQITSADAGSLYLVEAVETPPLTTGPAASPVLDSKCLRFILVQNDSIQLNFRETTMAISDQSIAGYVAMTGETVNIDDAYDLAPEVPYAVNRTFDEQSGYRTRSILAIPMRNPQGETLGVVQLINAKRDANAKLDSLSAIASQVIPFSRRYQELTSSLASQAAVALENSRLYASIQRLFEGFVKASVAAIEARDPTTSGHSFRVANLTIALAETVDRIDSGPYAGVRFTREQMKEIRYASLLHDFGKVGVREEVLVKARKLYPAQLDLVKQRFHLARRTLKSESVSARLDFLLKNGRDKYLARLPEFEARLASQIAELDSWWKYRPRFRFAHRGAGRQFRPAA